MEKSAKGRRWATLAQNRSPGLKARNNSFEASKHRIIEAREAGELLEVGKAFLSVHLQGDTSQPRFSLIRSG